jgi:hypothetical protein
MSSILDIKEDNSIELLNIPEEPELIDVSNYNDIQPVTTTDIVNTTQLDKTNIETYMNDFKKNFYKIKFDNTMFKEIAELHNITEQTTNGTDLKEKTFEEDSNNTAENKQIKALPIGSFKQFSSSINSSHINYTSNVITRADNLVKSKFIEDLTYCAGIEYGANMSLMYPTFSKIWKIASGDKVIPINMNLSIPAFNVYSSDVGIDFLDTIPVIDNGCSESKEDIVFCGYPCDANVQLCKKCVKFKIFGKRYKRCVPYPCGVKFKMKDQIFLKKSNYIPEKLISFDGVGINFNGKIENNFSVTFEMETNIPIQIIINIIEGIDKNKHARVKNSTDFKGLVTILKDIFTFENIVQIMYFAYSFLVDQPYTSSPFVDFLVTSIIVKFNFVLDHFRVNYGSHQFEVSGLTFNKTFEALEDGKFISFTYNPSLQGLKAEFYFFSGTLTELLLKIASENVKTYISVVIMNNPNIAIKGGMFLILILIIYETVLKNEEEINILNAIINKTNAQKEYITNLTNKNKILNNIITEIIKYYNILKSINISGATSLISNIIEKYDPFVLLSLGMCTSPAFPVVLNCCGSMEVDNINILILLKQVIIGIIDAFSKTAKVCDKIIDVVIDKIPVDEIKDLLNELNDKIEDANDVLRRLLIIAVQNVFELLDDAQFGVTVSPKIEWCIPL